MSDPSDNAPPTLGIFDPPPQPGITAVEVIATVLTVLWLAAAVAFYMLVPRGETTGGLDTLRFVVSLLAVFLPVAMIWVAATAARASRVMREESQRLHAAIDAMRQTYVADTQGRAMAQLPSVSKRLDEIAAAQSKTESALALISSRSQSQEVPIATPLAPAPDVGEQPALALGTPAEELAPPLPNADVIRALNFPETAEDEDGFAALRRALQDRALAGLIQAAQDVLTLLSQDGIYMDDLRPDMARPAIWRSFAQGTRGRVIAPLGGVRDRSSLALAAGRMKQDSIFRDAAHHFLRKFDQTFAGLEPNLSDAEIQALGDTRTARAFMLLGRVAGTFS